MSHLTLTQRDLATHDNGKNEEDIIEEDFKSCIDKFFIFKAWFEEKYRKKSPFSRIFRVAFPLMLVLLVFVLHHYQILGLVKSKILHIYAAYDTTSKGQSGQSKNESTKQKLTVSDEEVSSLIESFSPLDIVAAYNIIDRLSLQDKHAADALSKQIQAKWRKWIFSLKFEDIDSDELSKVLPGLFNYVKRRKLLGKLENDVLLFSYINMITDYYANKDSFSVADFSHKTIESDKNIAKLATIHGRVKLSTNHFLLAAEEKMLKHYVLKTKKLPLKRQFDLFKRVQKVYTPNSPLRRIINEELEQTSELLKTEKSKQAVKPPAGKENVAFLKEPSKEINDKGMGTVKEEKADKIVTPISGANKKNEVGQNAQRTSQKDLKLQIKKSKIKEPIKKAPGTGQKAVPTNKKIDLKGLQELLKLGDQI